MLCTRWVNYTSDVGIHYHIYIYMYIHICALYSVGKTKPAILGYIIIYVYILSNIRTV